MERELWSELTRAVGEVDAGWAEASRRYTHRTAAVVRVHLWSALHDRPTSWACDPRHWPGPPTRVLPDQSTASRRKRRPDFDAFLAAVGERLAGEPDALALVRRLDGKPLPVAAHSKDPDAAWGRGAGQVVNGYKLHALWAGRAMPEQWAVTPLDACEKRVARRFATRLGRCCCGGGGGGYVLADAGYDASDLHDRFAAAGHQLVAPRARPGAGLGHRYQSPHRLRSIALTEPPAGATNGFGPSLLAGRGQVERDFGNLTGFGGGLSGLPAWARRIWRVRSWVHAKLLVNAARIRCRRRAARA
jgi:hypothetical protein